MTVRTGMAALIAELRVMAHVGTADYSVAGVYYFGDQQLQDELDKTARIHRMAYMRAIGRQVGAASVIYQDYSIPPEFGPWLEGTVGGTAVWRVMDSVGNVIATTNYTVNLQQGLVTFNANQLGSATYLDCVEYNLNRAAANVWRWKGSNVAQSVDWSSDNHSVKASQKRQQALDMARYYSGLAGVTFSQFIRVDEN